MVIAQLLYVDVRSGVAIVWLLYVVVGVSWGWCRLCIQWSRLYGDGAVVCRSGREYCGDGATGVRSGGVVVMVHLMYVLVRNVMTMVQLVYVVVRVLW